MKHPLWTLLTVTVLGAAVWMGCEKKTAPEDGPPVPASVDSGEPSAVIAAVGDSLTEGYGLDEDDAYPALLEQKLRAAGHDVRVVNAGISGETSSGALSRVRWILTLNPDIVILETGANDGLRGIDPNLTRENIREIVRILKGEGVVVVLAGMEMVRNLGRSFTDAFRDIYPAVAAEEEVLLVPFFLEGVAGKAPLNLPDGIHPNEKGYRIVTDTVYPYVLEALDRLEAARSAGSATP